MKSKKKKISSAKIPKKVLDEMMRHSREQETEIAKRRKKIYKDQMTRKKPSQVDDEIAETFTIAKEEYEAIEKWKKRIKDTPSDAGVIGGTLEYVFIPTGMGMIKKVRHMHGHEFDFTEYDFFL